MWLKWSEVGLEEVVEEVVDRLGQEDSDEEGKIQTSESYEDRSQLFKFFIRMKQETISKF